MVHTHYHGNTQCDPSANPPFHNNSCNNRGAELSCALKTTGDHKGEYLCRHQGSAPTSKRTVKKTSTKMRPTKKRIVAKTTKKRKTIKKII